MGEDWPVSFLHSALWGRLSDPWRLLTVGANSSARVSGGLASFQVIPHSRRCTATACTASGLQLSIAGHWHQCDHVNHVKSSSSSPSSSCGSSSWSPLLDPPNERHPHTSPVRCTGQPIAESTLPPLAQALPCLSTGTRLTVVFLTFSLCRGEGGLHFFACMCHFGRFGRRDFYYFPPFWPFSDGSILIIFGPFGRFRSAVFLLFSAISGVFCVILALRPYVA